MEEVRFWPQRKYEVKNSFNRSCNICSFPCIPATKRTVHMEESKYTYCTAVGFFVRPQFECIRVHETGGGGGFELLLNIFQTSKVNSIACLLKRIKQSMDQH
jgi:hypothetical protein